MTAMMNEVEESEEGYQVSYMQGWSSWVYAEVN